MESHVNETIDLSTTATDDFNQKLNLMNPVSIVTNGGPGREDEKEITST